MERCVCKCGTIYDIKYNFCPYCGRPTKENFNESDINNSVDCVEDKKEDKIEDKIEGDTTIIDNSFNYELNTDNDIINSIIIKEEQKEDKKVLSNFENEGIKNKDVVDNEEVQFRETMTKNCIENRNVCWQWILSGVFIIILLLACLFIL